MELRKVEQELDALSSEWKELRRKRPQFDDNNNELCINVVLSNIMPTWKELKSSVKDEEIFPPEDVDVKGEEVLNDIDMKDDKEDTNNNTTDAPNNKEEDTGYSEFGMCLASTDNGEEDKAEEKKKDTKPNMFERYAAKSIAKESNEEKVLPQQQTTTNDNEEDEEQIVTQEEASPPQDVLAAFESLNQRFTALKPKIDKFMAKLKDRDPVTKKARYGEKTLPRVKNVIRNYKALEQGVSIVFQDDRDSGGPCIVSTLRLQIRQHEEEIKAKVQAQQLQEKLEAERLAKEKQLAEEQANQQRLLEEKKKRDEEKELARLAEEARVRRLEEEQRALDTERRADEELLAQCPTLGVEGVREQIGRMREALKDDRAALDTALGSLYTLFEQIVRKPEEINFRRVRRDHPKFMEDIGRHVGGREILICAGFTLEKLVTTPGSDAIPCYISKEPHIESDMDGWSVWFDTLKKTLAVIEEEMLK